MLPCGEGFVTLADIEMQEMQREQKQVVIRFFYGDGVYVCPIRIVSR